MSDFTRTINHLPLTELFYLTFISRLLSCHHFRFDVQHLLEGLCKKSYSYLMRPLFACFLCIFLLSVHFYPIMLSHVFMHLFFAPHEELGFGYLAIHKTYVKITCQCALEALFSHINNSSLTLRSVLSLDSSKNYSPKSFLYFSPHQSNTLNKLPHHPFSTTCTTPSLSLCTQTLNASLEKMNKCLRLSRVLFQREMALYTTTGYFS